MVSCLLSTRLCSINRHCVSCGNLVWVTYGTSFIVSFCVSLDFPPNVRYTNIVKEGTRGVQIQ